MSNNLALAQVAAAQNNKEVTINDQAGQLDAALTVPRRCRRRQCRAHGGAVPPGGPHQGDRRCHGRPDGHASGHQEAERHLQFLDHGQRRLHPGFRDEHA
jgi:hypothetical protein